MRNLTLKTAFLFINAILFVFVSQAQSIEGTIKDPYSNEVKPFVNVVLEQNNNIIKSTVTDLEGYFYFDNIKNGNYSIKLLSLDAEKVIENIVVNNEDVAFSMDFDDTYQTEIVDVVWIKDLLVKEKITKFDNEILKTQKPRVITDILKTTVGTVETNEGISFKGARPGTAVYYIDGVRTYGDLYIPISAVNNIEVYTGGVPAHYGNSTSGVIVVETKSYFDNY